MMEEITVREFLKRNLSRKTLEELAVLLKVPVISTAQLRDEVNTVKVSDTGVLVTPEEEKPQPKPRRRRRTYPPQQANPEQFKLTDAPVEPPQED